MFPKQAKLFLRYGFLFSILLLVIPGMACGSNGEGGEKLRVVTTVSPITSIVENIGGNRIQLEGVVPEGVNSHVL